MPLPRLPRVSIRFPRLSGISFRLPRLARFAWLLPRRTWLARLPRMPWHWFRLPRLSPVTRANASAIGIFVVTLTIINWNTHAKSAGAYRGAVPPQITDQLVMHQPTQAAGASGSAPSASVAAGPKIEGKLAMRLKQALMLDAKAKLLTIPDYVTTFTRQERVQGKLLERESSDLKVRHTPFSVYMKTTEGHEVGREILFIEGQNDNRMLVKKGGKLGEALPTFKIEPDSALALKEARYPLTTSGLMKLVDKIVDYCARDVKLDEGYSCQFLPDQKIDGRMCYVIRTDYTCAEVDPDYRVSIIFADKATAIPLCVKNYGWSDKCGAAESANEKLTDETLIEFYAFTGLQYRSRLADVEFDQANAQYHFRR